MAPAWQIYKDEMDCFERGDALWQPAPLNATRIRIGDVGLILTGRFYLLFSAGCELGERERGKDVPDTFEPLIVGDLRRDLSRAPDCLRSETIQAIGVDVGASVSTTLPVEAGAHFSYELTGTHGAALMTKYPTNLEDVMLVYPFEEYTRRHYESWVKFARHKQHGNDARPVLVSGFDVTKDFAMVAYSNWGMSLGSDATIAVPILGSASASAWGTWRARRSPHTNFGPQGCSLPPPERAIVSPSHNTPGTKRRREEKKTPPLQPVDAGSAPAEFDQYVFVRYYTMRSKLKFIRQVVPNVMKARAGTPDLGPGENRGDAFPEFTAQPDTETTTNDDEDLRGQHGPTAGEPDSEPDVVVHNTSYDEGYDRWDAIADYVFQNSNAVSVLMHHQDLKGMRMAGDTDSVSTLLAKHRPQIVVDASGVGRLSHQGIQRPGLEPQTTGDTIPTPESHSAATAVSDIPIEVKQHVHSSDDVDPSASGPITTHILETQEMHSVDSYSSPGLSELTDHEEDFTESESEANIRKRPTQNGKRSIDRAARLHRGDNAQTHTDPIAEDLPQRRASLMSSPSLSAFKTFYNLDRSSLDFDEQLSDVLYGDEYEQWVQNLDNDGLVWLVDYLDEALDRLDPSSSTSKKCLRELSSICGTRVILPTSYALSSALLDIGRDPFAQEHFADVYQGTLDGSKVCIKRIRLYADDNVQQTTQIFCREAAKWKHLSHPNILPLLGITNTPRQFISSWICGVDLQGYIKKHPNAGRLRLVSDVAKGLWYIHSCNVIHGNLNGSTIFVDDSGHARIADCGLAMVTQNLDSVQTASLQCGPTPRWTAPEILNEQGVYNKESDIFSFAMVMVEIFTGAIPLSDSSTTPVFAITKGGRLPRPTHPTFTESLWRLVQRCWDNDPDMRPDALEILRVLLTIPTLGKDECISLIKTIPLGGSRAEMAEQLSEEDVQNFIDNIDKVLDSLLPVIRGRYSLCLFRVCGHYALFPRSLEIPLCYHPTENPLCHGGRANIWKGQYQGREVAAKVRRVFSSNDPEHIRSRFCQEVVSWRAFRHPDVLPLLGVTITKNRFVMVSEWMAKGTILEFLKADFKADRLGLLEGVARGLAYIHNQGYFHGNLNGANILINDNGCACLAGLGVPSLAPNWSLVTPSDMRSDAIRCMSPELLEESGPTPSSDCYALGMVIYEVLSGQTPYVSYSQSVMISKILDGERPGRPEGEAGAWFTAEIWEMLELCWKPEPYYRPSADAVLQCLQRAPRPSWPMVRHAIGSLAVADGDNEIPAPL